MSEPTQPPPYPVIPPEEFKTSWLMPHILTFYDGQETRIIEGGSRQVNAVTRISYHDAAQVTPPLFAIRATNRLQFGGVVIPVINDRIEGERPLAPTSPTASEYLALRGQEVLHAFACERDHHTERLVGHPVWRVARVSIVLP